MTEIGGKNIPIKNEVAAPAPVLEEDIWGGNNRPHSLRRYLSTLLVTEQRRRLLWLSFLTSVPPSSPPATRIITRSGVTRCCLLWSLVSAVMTVQVLCRYLPSGVNMRGNCAVVSCVDWSRHVKQCCLELIVGCWVHTHRHSLLDSKILKITHQIRSLLTSVPWVGSGENFLKRPSNIFL